MVIASRNSTAVMNWFGLNRRRRASGLSMPTFLRSSPVVSKTSRGRPAVTVEIRRTHANTVDICNDRSSLTTESPTTPEADTGPFWEPFSGDTRRPPTKKLAMRAQNGLRVRRSML
ncbi:hypothetical protein D3C78_1268040 [compost metagenome]